MGGPGSGPQGGKKVGGSGPKRSASKVAADQKHVAAKTARMAKSNAKVVVVGDRNTAIRKIASGQKNWATATKAMKAGK